MKYLDSCDEKDVFDNITRCRQACEVPFPSMDHVPEGALTCIQNNLNQKYCCESISTIQRSIEKNVKISLAIGGIFAGVVLICIVSYCIVLHTNI